MPRNTLGILFDIRNALFQNDVLFPDSVVGTDNHTGMVNGLGVLGWKVGTLEAEAVMFGHPLTLPRLPKVVGVRLTGTLAPYSTSTDLVMLITKHLRNRDCNGATSLSQDQQPGYVFISNLILTVPTTKTDVGERCVAYI